MKRRNQWQKDIDAKRACMLEPDVMPPKYGEPLTVGWHYNTYNLQVDVGCSSSIYHSIYETTKTTTQGARAFYSTKKLALIAMRLEIEYDHFKRLQLIDQRLIEIADERRESEAK